ncbi:MFS general substrate transporter [Collybia nuda]|uniref:MFS general substrate transporter n=1 Tax=Collybia nuda TaxID=64659 RepID=A0A9P6CD70_9AGAR|nr:MFS general substrate transporter [Collybia nuda]
MVADEIAPLLRSDTLSSDTGSRNRAGYGALVSPVEGSENGSLDAEGVREGPKSFLKLIIPMSIGIFLAAMDNTIVVSSYAAIGSELNQLQNTSWIATAYMLTMTSFQPLYGKLSDIFGRKGSLLSAYSIFAIGSLSCGLARNMTELIVSRALAGIGGGGMSTMVSIILSDVIPLRSRGTWQGIINIVFATGSAAGAPLGGLFADTIGWRWAFLMQFPMALLAIISVSVALHLPKLESSNFSAKIRRVDFGGAAALVITVFLLLFGLDRGGNIAWDDTLTILAMGGFAVFAVLFGVIEMRLAREPLAPKRIIVNSSLIASYLVNLFGVAAQMSMLFHVSLYLQAVERKSASEAGLWLIPSVVGSLVGSLGGGLIMQAMGKFYLVTVYGYVFLFVGTGIVILMTGTLIRSVHGLVVGLIIGSIGIGSGITTSLIALIANAGQADQAIATAVSYLFRSMGSVVGVSIGSTLVQETLRSYLRRRLSGNDVEEIIQHVRESLSYLDELDPATRIIVRSAYEKAIQVTLSFTVAMAACGLVSSIFIKEKALSR